MRKTLCVGLIGVLVQVVGAGGCGGDGSAGVDGTSSPDVGTDAVADVVGDLAVGDVPVQGDVDLATDVPIELPPDTLPPLVKIVSPKDGAVVTGEQTVVVDATDDRGMAVVDIYLEEALLGSVSMEPFELLWDTTGLATGNYRLIAVATDEAGNAAQDEVEVLVQGSCDENGDCPPKSVKIITPVAGSTVCGTVTIEATAQDDFGIAEVEFLVDGDSLGVDVESPYQKDWNTTKDSKGEHVVKVLARDTAGHEAFAAVTVLVDNTGGSCDNLPNVMIEQPKDGDYLYGTVDVVAKASDDIGVLKVQFFIDNALVVEDATVPYKTEWNTEDFDEGAHTLKAIAYDTGNQMGSMQIQVTVDRTPPEVEITSPDTEAPFQDVLPVTVTASDNFVVKQVELYLEYETEPVVLTKPPHEAELDLSGVPSGTHTLVARVVDGAGHEDEDFAEILVDRPPTVAFVAPKDGDTVYGEVPVAVEAIDDLSEPDVEFYVDGGLVGQVYGGEYVWQTPYEKAQRMLKVVARDEWDQTASVEISVLVDHPVVADLQVCQGATCNSLADGTELTGIVKLKVEAKDDGADIASVEFHVDGNLVNVDNAPPWENQWDSESVTDGFHTLKAVAVNTLAEKGQDTVEVLVNNCDLDHDSYLAKKCDGTDCDDLDPGKNPGKPDTVGNDVDENCDGIDGMDGDGDGYASVGSGGKDCDDAKANVYPCADDIASDGIDANCDGKDVASCDDCDACTLDKLDAGVCKHTAIGEGQACDDGDACTTGKKCTGGVCGKGAALNCSDGNACTLDACDPVAGCIHGPDLAKDGQPCPGGVCFAGACCAPACSGKECGDNGCGGNCGTCAQGKTCDAGSGKCLSAPEGMVLVPVGKFWMGCNEMVDSDCDSDEYPYHEVYLDAYYVDKTEVTVDAYGKCVTAGGCTTPGSGSGYCNWNKAGKGQHPVNCVDWYQAKAYCEWAQQRLCTEAEWEKAARGNDGRKYPWGNAGASCDYAVMYELGGYGCGKDSTWAVGSKPLGASPYGVLDMAGNVWEWTADWYSKGYYSASPANNPKGPNSGSDRVGRGGSFDGSVDDFLRVSYRVYDFPSYDCYDLGLRCCRSE